MTVRQTAEAWRIEAYLERCDVCAANRIPRAIWATWVFQIGDTKWYACDSHLKALLTENLAQHVSVQYR